MGYFRSTLAYQGGGGIDYSATYTVSINGEKQDGYCGYQYDSANNMQIKNRVITIGNNVTNCVFMFNNTRNVSFSEDIVIPARVNNCGRMFSNSDFDKNIYVKGTVSRVVNIAGMFYNANNSKKKNIYFNTVLNSIFNKTTASSSIVGTSITWATTTNGFYNSAYNIYCYYNYEG